MSHFDSKSGSQKVKKSLWDSNWEPKKIGPAAPTNHSFSTRSLNKSDLWRQLCLKISSWRLSSMTKRQCVNPLFISYITHKVRGFIFITLFFILTSLLFPCIIVKICDVHLIRSPHRVSNAVDCRSLTTNPNRLRVQTTGVETDS